MGKEWKLCVCVFCHSVVSDSFETPWTVTHHAPLSTGFSRQEYRSGLPFPSPMETVRDFISGASKITADGDCSHEIKRHLPLGRKVMNNLDSILKSRDITLLTKVHLVKAMVFPVVMWELDCKESWAPKNWCFSTVVLEKTLESPLDSKEIQPVNPKGNQSWIFTGRTDAEAKTPIFWPSDVKNWLIWKDPDAGKDWRREKGMTEDEMVEWHHWLNGHGFE